MRVLYRCQRCGRPFHTVEVSVLDSRRIHEVCVVSLVELAAHYRDDHADEDKAISIERSLVAP